MPERAARSAMRGRPPLGLGRSTGKSGATSAHSVSLTRYLLMPAIYHTACGFVRRSKLPLRCTVITSVRLFVL
jgi:hypothetical protein